MEFSPLSAGKTILRDEFDPIDSYAHHQDCFLYSYLIGSWRSVPSQTKPSCLFKESHLVLQQVNFLTQKVLWYVHFYVSSP